MPERWGAPWREQWRRRPTFAEHYSKVSRSAGQQPSSSYLPVRCWHVSTPTIIWPDPEPLLGWFEKYMGGAARPDRAREASDRGILGAGAYWADTPDRCLRPNSALRRWQPPPPAGKRPVAVLRVGSLSKARSLACGRRGPAPSRVLRTPGLRLLPPTPRSPAAQRADRRSSFLRHQRRFRSCRDESLSPLVRSGLLP